MLNKLDRTDEIEGVMRETFENMGIEETDPELQSILQENLAKFLKSFDMKDMMPMVEKIKETEAILKEQIGTANTTKEVVKFWNHLGCKCARCQRKMEDSESQIFNEVLKWSTTSVKDGLPFENRDIDELD